MNEPVKGSRKSLGYTKVKELRTDTMKEVWPSELNLFFVEVYGYLLLQKTYGGMFALTETMPHPSGQTFGRSSSALVQVSTLS